MLTVVAAPASAAPVDTESKIPSLLRQQADKIGKSLSADRKLGAARAESLSADVLTLTLLRQGEGSDAWRQQLKATGEIIAACSSGDASDSPGLTAHVESSLSQVGYHDDEAGVIAQRLTADFVAGSENGGVDELHIVSTRFVNMVTQEVQVVRLLPLEVVEDEEPVADEDIYPLYEFEPDGAQVLDALLPKYVTSRIWNAPPRR